MRDVPSGRRVDVAVATPLCVLSGSTQAELQPSVHGATARERGQPVRSPVVERIARARQRSRAEMIGSARCARPPCAVVAGAARAAAHTGRGQQPVDLELGREESSADWTDRLSGAARPARSRAGCPSRSRSPGPGEPPPRRAGPWGQPHPARPRASGARRSPRRRGTPRSSLRSDPRRPRAQRAAGSVAPRPGSRHSRSAGRCRSGRSRAGCRRGPPAA